MLVQKPAPIIEPILITVIYNFHTNFSSEDFYSFIGCNGEIIGSLISMLSVEQLAIYGSHHHPYWKKLFQGPQEDYNRFPLKSALDQFKHNEDNGG